MDVADIGLALHPPARQLAAGRLKRTVDLRFDLRQGRIVEVAKDIVDHSAAQGDRRHVGAKKRGPGHPGRQRRVVLHVAAAKIGHIAAKDDRGRVVLVGVGGLVTK